MTADKLCRGVNNDVRAVLNRSEQEGSCEGAVNHERNVVPVSDLGERLDVNNIRVRIAESLDVERLCILVDGVLKRAFLVGIDKGRADTVVSQRMRKQVVGAAVNRLRGDNVIARVSESLNRIRDSRRARGYGKSRAAALKSRDPLLKNGLGGVCKSAVDIARVSESEAISGVLTVVEHI